MKIGDWIELPHDTDSEVIAETKQLLLEKVMFELEARIKENIEPVYKDIISNGKRCLSIMVDIDKFKKSLG